jgi:hypothetical protein
MGTALAFGAVSAVLRQLLDRGLAGAVPLIETPVRVTAVAPDSIRLDDPTAPPQLNLFLYRVTMAEGPAGFDLHYLLTAYGHEDLQAEILLGYGMQLLHEHHYLDRSAVRRALRPDLGDQLETVTIAWEPLGTDELSRLWSAMRAHYRPSAGYHVSAVLTEQPVRPAHPVLEGVALPGGKDVAELGDVVTLRGHHLAGTAASVQFAHRLLTTAHEILLGTVTDTDTAAVRLPAAAGLDWPAGVWSVTAQMVPPGEVEPRRTNTVAMLLAPTADLPPVALRRDRVTGAVTVTLQVRPPVRPEQPAVLALGSTEVAAFPRTGTVDQLSFVFDSLPAGEAWVRLRVDGAQSPLVDRSTVPPTFRSGRSLTVPP